MRSRLIQVAWLALQAGCVALSIYAFSDIAEHDGTKFHVGQAFMIGIVMAFLATIAVKFMMGLLRLIWKPEPIVPNCGTRNAPDKLL